MWLLALFGICFWKTHNLVLSLVIILWLLLGVLNLTLLKILFGYLSPRGYENLFASFFHSTFWVLSGAAFPLSFLNISNNLKFYSPISLVVGLPIEIFPNPHIANQLLILVITLVGLLWSFLIYRLNLFIENRWRSLFYV